MILVDFLLPGSERPNRNESIRIRNSGIYYLPEKWSSDRLAVRGRTEGKPQAGHMPGQKLG